MIIVRVHREPGGFITRLAVSGHAGYDVHGKDIVCAAVSALAQTAALGIQALGLNPFVRAEAGDFELRLNQEHLEQKEAVRAVLDSIVLGLKNIESNYPKFVKVFCDGGDLNDG